MTNGFTATVSASARLHRVPVNNLKTTRYNRAGAEGIKYF